MNYASNVFRHTHTRTKQHHFRFRNKNEPSEVSKRRHNWNNNSIPTNVIFRFRHLKCTCWDFVKFPSRLRRSCNDDTTERDKFLMPYLRTLSQLTFAMLRFRGRATKKNRFLVLRKWNQIFLCVSQLDWRRADNFYGFVGEARQGPRA